MTKVLDSSIRMNRREVLKSAGVLLTTGIGAGCAARLTSVTPDVPRRFTRVNVSRDRVIRTVVGLRPFRPSGFVVRAETVDGKTIIHNYGHGGGGMTMSWGTSHLAVEEALKTGQTRYAVLGCGGVGLATARLLQRHGFEVTIYAKDLPPNTTSNIAGAQWSPAESFDVDRRTPEFMEQFTRAARLSHRYFQDLVGDHYGVRWIENYLLSEKPFEERPGSSRSTFQDLYPYGKLLQKWEHPFPAPYVRRFVTMFIEPPVYLNAVLRDFFISGGRLVVKEFCDLEAVLALPESVVINCTGLGAKVLFADEELMPIKGQLTVLLPQSGLDYLTIGPGDLYMFPRRDGILLGGTHERHDWTLEPNRAEADRIVDGHIALFRRMR